MFDRFLSSWLVELRSRCTAILSCYKTLLYSGIITRCQSLCLPTHPHAVTMGRKPYGTPAQQQFLYGRLPTFERIHASRSYDANRAFHNETRLEWVRRFIDPNGNIKDDLPPDVRRVSCRSTISSCIRNSDTTIVHIFLVY